ncbi:diguanylate cyclase [Tumebacillus sp. DT12]|uniref:Diguanylate cyclase n=1 Tax=Tumebacillus lacus TaxID=2995335 RepID=A0ABT3X4V9_9BACL|nr:diguanylate cyclase [Tumebacillus lacus]MCX7571935.1 diguanylate cyclase [Tumebacillus lacus]
MSDHREKREKNQKLLRKTRKLYVQDLGKQIEELELCLRELNQEFDPELASQVYRIAHKMKGSAPIFGFERAGRIAETFLVLYGWANEEDGIVPASRETLIHQSREHLLQLKMEQEVCAKEIEVDELDLQTVQAPLAMQGRLLLIDDDDLLRSYLVKQLELAGYRIDDASDVETAKAKLRESAYDVILLDLMMYPQSGYELFDFLKEDPTLKWIPLVVLSGRDDLDDKVRCLRLGADDYVTKPFEYEELEARIFSLLKRSKQFEQMAFRDALTGVYNRRYFDHHLQMVLQWVQQDDKPISLAFLDIDRFKSINDTYGHQVGDMVLQGLGHLLQQNLRTTDLLARYGGEELVILFQDTTAEQAAIVMHRILEKVRVQPLVRAEGQGTCITFSAGVAQWQPGLTEKRWIAMADDAMYRAKQAGRDRVVVAGAEGALELPSGEGPAVPRRRILIADDDVIITSILQSKLRDLPVDIEVVNDGEAAREHLQRGLFDLLILDGVMPKLDGFSLLESMRPELQQQGVKVLMLSAQKREEDIVRGLTLGADDYMSKPFSLLELEIRVKRLLNLED